jgi:hypothetical protein
VSSVSLNDGHSTGSIVGGEQLQFMKDSEDFVRRIGVPRQLPCTHYLFLRAAITLRMEVRERNCK